MHYFIIKNNIKIKNIISFIFKHINQWMNVCYKNYSLKTDEPNDLWRRETPQKRWWKSY